MKMCILEDDKICDECGMCNYCEFDSEKICDNCMKCVTGGAESMSVTIDKIITPVSPVKTYKKK